MTKKSNEVKFRELQYHMEDLHGCCGVLVAYSFTEQTAYDYDYWNSKRVHVPAKFATKQEQAKDAVDKILRHAKTNLYYCIQISLVHEYNTDAGFKAGQQLPELHDALQEAGFHIDREWTAPRHGNRLRLYSIILEGAEDVPVGGNYVSDEEEDEDVL